MNKLILVILLILIIPIVGFSEPLCSHLNPKTIKDETSPDIVAFHRTHELICLVHYISKPYGFPETMQAILRQETGVGKYKTPKHVEKLEWAAFGIMQIQPTTARWVLVELMGARDIPKDDNMLKVKLQVDPAFSIHIASVYFHHLYNLYLNKGFSTGASWRYAVLAYNIGPTKLANMNYDYDPNGYLNHIRDKLKIVRAYNEVYGLM